MSCPATDAETIAASVSDSEAFVEIFDRHHAPISRYLRRRLDATTAEELTAEVFAIAFARRASYDPSRTNALPWLYGIAANLVRVHAREEQRELAALARTGIDPLDSSREQDVPALTGPSAALAQALLELQLADREVLLLLAWGGLTYEQIATALGIPIGTVKSRLNRARTVLRRTLAAATEEVTNG